MAKNTELEKINKQLADQYIELKEHFDNEYEIRQSIDSGFQNEFQAGQHPKSSSFNHGQDTSAATMFDSSSGRSTSRSGTMATSQS